MPSLKRRESIDTNHELTFAGLLGACRECGLIYIDARRRVRRLDRQAAKLLGLRRRPVSRQPFESLPKPLQRVALAALASGRPSVSRSIRLDHASGDPLTIGLSALPSSPGKKPAGVWLILQNLNTGQQAENNLLHLDRLASIGMLSSSLAHEMKNALVAGKTFFDLLLDKHQDTEMVEIVRRELTRIDSLVGRMLRFTSPGKPSLITVHLHQVLDHALRLMQHQLDLKMITLNRSYGAVSDWVRGDESQLEQAFVNLLLNALDAMGPHGQLTILTQPKAPATAKGGPARHAPSAPQISVTVQDTGIGIPPENLERLFGPFFTTKYGGTGLGLAITRRIIQEHGGTISVNSKPNEGAAFEILLPALESA